MENLRKKVETTFSEKQRAKIHIFEPEEFFQFLDQENAKEASKEVRTKGYRVKVEYSAVSTDEAKHISESITKTVTEAVQKKGKM